MNGRQTGCCLGRSSGGGEGARRYIDSDDGRVEALLLRLRLCCTQWLRGPWGWEEKTQRRTQTHDGGYSWPGRQTQSGRCDEGARPGASG